MSDRTLAAAFKAAITSALTTGNVAADPRAHPVAMDFDEAQDAENAGTLPYIYVVVSVSRRFGGNQRATSTRTLTGWRLTTTCVAPTVDGARWATERVATLENSRLTVADLSLSPILFESSNPPARDNNFFTGVTFWTTVSTPV